MGTYRQDWRLSTISLTWKLTLAFLLVGMVGVMLFVLLLGQGTRVEFDRFLSDRDQAVLIAALSNHFHANGTWQDVHLVLANTPPLEFFSRNSVLADEQGRVVMNNPPYSAGQWLTDEEVENSTPIYVNDRVVGYIIFRPMSPPPGHANSPGAAEARFLRRILEVAVTSALVTGLLALLLGFVLARTLTGPLRELTIATRALASGDLQQQVTVRSQDEIGQLAHSFNQMSADLARGSQLRKQMTADLAHDLRTPLSILRGYIEGLKEERMEADPALFELLFEEVIHLQRLIEDLRVLSLVDAGELSLNRRVVDPAALLERAGLAHMAAAEQQGLALRVEIPAPLPSVAVDTDRMAQVFNNLVANALRHTASGEIVLTARVVGDEVQMAVRDSGHGIDPDDLPFVFDRFYRGDKARQRVVGDSSGLGLAIAKALTEEHGGTLTVESEEGRGSTFTVTLPSAPVSIA